MIEFENTVTPSGEQWRSLILGARNAMNSWEKSDSYLDYDFDVTPEGGTTTPFNIRYVIGPNDYDLMTRLRNAGTDHRKFMRMITVYVDITAPLYWWKEFDTYKVGTVANSCSTMHTIHKKEFTLDDFSHEHLQSDSLAILENVIHTLNLHRKWFIDKVLDDPKIDWWQMIQLLPSSYNQKRTVMLNYEVLANMYKSRKNHKLDEWHILCDWMETLPYSELITGECSAPSTKNTSRVVRHAYIRSIEKGFPDEGPYLRMYTRGYEDGKPGLGAENTIDAALLIDPDDIPFEKGTLVKVTIEAEEA